MSKLKTKRIFIEVPMSKQKCLMNGTQHSGTIKSAYEYLGTARKHLVSRFCDNCTPEFEAVCNNFLDREPAFGTIELVGVELLVDNSRDALIAVQERVNATKTFDLVMYDSLQNPITETSVAARDKRRAEVLAQAKIDKQNKYSIVFRYTLEERTEATI